MLIIEAMKMEHSIIANNAGVVKNVNVQPGTLVLDSDELCAVEAQ